MKDFIDQLAGDDDGVAKDPKWANSLQVDISLLTVTLVRGDVALIAPLHSVLKAMSAASKQNYDIMLDNINKNNSTDKDLT